MQPYLDKLAKAPLSNKVGGLVALVVAVTGLNWFLLVSDLDTRIEQQGMEQERLERDLAEKTALANNLNKHLQEMEELETRLAEALTELPERKDIEELLAQLNDIGRKVGLNIEKVEPAGEQRDPGLADFVARLPVKMSVKGNFHEVALFLQEVGNLRRIVNVTNLKLGAPTERGEKVVLAADFIATAFRFLPKQDPAKNKNQAGQRVAGPTQ